VTLLWLAYAIGGIGIIVEWRAYLLHCGRGFRRWSATGAVLWSAMYFLLGAWTAALTMGSTALRTMLSGGGETVPPSAAARSVLCSTALLRRGLISADFYPPAEQVTAGEERQYPHPEFQDQLPVQTSCAKKRERISGTFGDE